MTDFQKYERVRMSGRINMFDISSGVCLTGLSREKYLDIMNHYDDYRSGNRI